MLWLLGSLRGVRIQLLLWTVLPLTLVLVAVALAGISLHQRSMRAMVEELDARSAKLAAAHLEGEFSTRAALLNRFAQAPSPTLSELSQPFFDGGVARFGASGQLIEAIPSPEIWRRRPVTSTLSLEGSSSGPLFFSPLFIDPLTGRNSLVMVLKLEAGGAIAGAVSLEQLGVSTIIGRVYGSGETQGQAGPGLEHSHLSAAGEPLAFLVNEQGQVIYHPNAALIGQDLRDYEGVAQVIQGQAGATYHREPDGEEWAVGYAPVAGPGWGLIVQEPWEALIAPTMRFSLLAPLTVVVAALVSGLAITFGLHYVIRPLQLLDRQATRVAWGDFSTLNQPVGGVQEIEDLRRTLAGMAGQIQHYQTGMRDYIAAVTMAQEEERKRLARELHDETIQALIALGQRVEMAQKVLAKDPERARQRLAELNSLVQETQQEVRRFSRALRPLYLEDLGLVPAVEMLAQETERQSALTISLRIGGAVRRLAPELELTAYRIVQEGLSNVIRHAQAQNVWVSLTFAAEGLTLRLQDDGQGFEPPLNPAELVSQGHFGLMGIRERTLLLGGRLEISSSPEQGTVLEVFLP